MHIKFSYLKSFIITKKTLSLEQTEYIFFKLTDLLNSDQTYNLSVGAYSNSSLACNMS